MSNERGFFKRLEYYTNKAKNIGVGYTSADPEEAAEKIFKLTQHGLTNKISEMHGLGQAFRNEMKTALKTNFADWENDYMYTNKDHRHDFQKAVANELSSTFQKMYKNKDDRIFSKQTLERDNGAGNITITTVKEREFKEFLSEKIPAVVELHAATFLLKSKGSALRESGIGQSMSLRPGLVCKEHL